MCLKTHPCGHIGHHPSKKGSKTARGGDFSSQRQNGRRQGQITQKLAINAIFCNNLKENAMGLVGRFFINPASPVLSCLFCRPYVPQSGL
jgi:hypothetical protein